MEVDPMEAVESKEEGHGGGSGHHRLNGWVAITIALVATFRHEQFDLSDAMIALAISLLALTALTHKTWLFWVGLIPTAGGVLMGSAGLFGWHVHSELLARLLA